MFKIDTHVHTSETSVCGEVEAREMVRLYKELGYQGVIVTDHYFDSYFDKLTGLSWDKKIDRFLGGYYHAREEGNKQGLKVFLGLEIRFTENPSDYLVYGITEQFIREHKELYALGLKEFKKLIDQEEILIVQAHPYRKHMVVAEPQYIHGIEIYNGNPRHDSHNDLALAYAKKHSLFMSSGSDFHQLGDQARGGMVFGHEINTSVDFVKALREGAALELLKTL